MLRQKKKCISNPGHKFGVAYKKYPRQILEYYLCATPNFMNELFSIYYSNSLRFIPASYFLLLILSPIIVL